MKFLIVLACLVVYANAHACLLYPQQRGSIPPSAYSNAGDDACFRTDNPPCGGIAQERPEVHFMPGEMVTVTFQKNLDHFYANNPGSWDLFYWVGTTSTSLVSIKDSADIKSLQVINVNVTMPNAAADMAIIQLVYVTNNPNAPAKFYQCADITVGRAGIRRIRV